MLGYTRNEILLFLGRKYHDYLLIILIVLYYVPYDTKYTYVWHV